jgi:hypothetical protein
MIGHPGCHREDKSDQHRVCPDELPATHLGLANRGRQADGQANQQPDRREPGEVGCDVVGLRLCGIGQRRRWPNRRFLTEELPDVEQKQHSREQRDGAPQRDKRVTLPDSAEKNRPAAGHSQHDHRLQQPW